MTIPSRFSLETAVLLGALLFSTAPLSAQVAPPPAPPAPPLPPGLQPFQIVPPPATKAPPGPSVLPAPATPVPGPVPAATATPAYYGPLTNFAWEAEQKELFPKPGDSTVHCTFWFTNISDKEVVINSVRTSCGCTVAKLPATPWHIQPGTNGPIEVTMDLRGKQGTIAKAVTAETTAGSKSLIVKVTIPDQASLQTGFPVNHPPMGDADRLANMQAALKDRQVVFKDAKCATCHADPAKGHVDGATLYRGVCATCHDSPLRAAAVTDLKSLKHETDLDYWKHWITNGKEGSMMPAYALAHGGPLNDFQINALATYCLNTFKPVVPTNATLFTPGGGLFPTPLVK